MIRYYWSALLITACDLLMRAPLPRGQFLSLLILKQDLKYAQECAIRRAVLKAMQ